MATYTNLKSLTKEYYPGFTRLYNYGTGSIYLKAGQYLLFWGSTGASSSSDANPVFTINGTYATLINKQWDSSSSYRLLTYKWGAAPTDGYYTIKGYYVSWYFAVCSENPTYVSNGTWSTSNFNITFQDANKYYLIVSNFASVANATPNSAICETTDFINNFAGTYIPIKAGTSGTYTFKASSGSYKYQIFSFNSPVFKTDPNYESIELEPGDVIELNDAKQHTFDFSDTIYQKVHIDLYGFTQMSNWTPARGGKVSFDIDTKNLSNKFLTWAASGGSSLCYKDSYDPYYRIGAAGDAGHAEGGYDPSAQGGGLIADPSTNGEYAGSGGTQTARGSHSTKHGDYSYYAVAGASVFGEAISYTSSNTSYTVKQGLGGAGWYAGGTAYYVLSSSSSGGRYLGGGGSSFLLGYDGCAGTNDIALPSGYMGDDSNIVSTLESCISNRELVKGGAPSLSSNTTRNGMCRITVLFDPEGDLQSIYIPEGLSTQQTTFDVGDTFNSTGLVVKAVFANGEERVTEDCTISTPDMTTPGYKTITIEYTYEGVTKTTSYQISVNDCINFSYTGSVQSTTLAPGRYKLQVWGAQGGTVYTNTARGGVGGYSEGILNLSESTTVYVQVGGQPSTSQTSTGSMPAGYNGGGGGQYSGSGKCGGGGGGTDIRIGSNSLYARVIVAGGGVGAVGGSSYTFDAYNTRSGGGTTGGAYDSSYQATQTSGNAFGTGQTGYYYNYGCGTPGAGGGWYGGKTVQYGTSSSTGTQYYQLNGGGSGYVYTSDTAANYPSGCLLNSTYYLEDAFTKGYDVDSTIPAPDYSAPIVGREGNGYAKITSLETIESIEITHLPNKTTYIVDETFDPTGLIVTANYSDNTSQALPSSGYTLSTPDMTTAGTKTITVTASDQTATFTILVKSITAVSADPLPTKTTYFVGETFDPSGLVVTVYYSDSSSQVLSSNEYTLTSPDMTTPGTKTVQVVYQIHYSTAFDITVSAIELASISVETMPTTVEYDIDATFDPTGLTIRKTYNNSDTSVISSGFTLSTPDMTTGGTKTVTVTYTEGGITKTTTFDIYVKNNSYVSIYDGSQWKPATVNYAIKNPFNKGRLTNNCTNTFRFATDNSAAVQISTLRAGTAKIQDGVLLQNRFEYIYPDTLTVGAYQYESIPNGSYVNDSPIDARDVWYLDGKVFMDTYTDNDPTSTSYDLRHWVYTDSGWTTILPDWGTLSRENQRKFRGRNIWSDGETVYYSNGTIHRIVTLNENSTTGFSLSTAIAFNGLTNFDPQYIWTDGENIYYSAPGSTTNNYVLTKSTRTWTQISFSYHDIVQNTTTSTTVDGSKIWTDGENIYETASSYSSYKLVDKTNRIWETASFSGDNDFRLHADYVDAIWTDGKDVYFNIAGSNYKLNKSTRYWTAVEWYYTPTSTTTEFGSNNSIWSLPEPIGGWKQCEVYKLIGTEEMIIPDTDSIAAWEANWYGSWETNDRTAYPSPEDLYRSGNRVRYLTDDQNAIGGWYVLSSDGEDVEDNWDYDSDDREYYSGTAFLRYDAEELIPGRVYYIGWVDYTDSGYPHFGVYKGTASLVDSSWVVTNAGSIKLTKVTDSDEKRRVGFFDDTTITGNSHYEYTEVYKFTMPELDQGQSLFIETWMYVDKDDLGESDDETVYISSLREYHVDGTWKLIGGE